MKNVTVITLVLLCLVPLASADVKVTLTVAWAPFAANLYTGTVCIENTDLFGIFDTIIMEYSHNEHSDGFPSPRDLFLQNKGGNIYCANLEPTYWNSTSDTLDNIKITIKNNKDVIFQDDKWSTNVPVDINDSKHAFNLIHIICVDNDDDNYYSISATCLTGNDCNDSNSSIHPGVIEVCDGIDNDCDEAVDESFSDFDGDGMAYCIDPDDDNDGCNNTIDYILGNSTNIHSNVGTVLFSVDGEFDPKTRIGLGNVVFENNNKPIIEFDYFFSNETIFNLELVNISINSNNGTGSIIIKGIDLSSQNRTKTVYVDDLDNATDAICIKDKEISSILEINSNCDGADEISINCNNENGTTVTYDGRNYTCTKLSGNYKIEWLLHSGVMEYTYVAPSSPPSGGGGGGRTERTCTESWQCTNWGPTVCPSTSRQTRTCTDINNCGTAVNKPNEVRICFYYVAPKEKEEEVVEVATEEAPQAIATPPPELIPQPPTPKAKITGAAIIRAYQREPPTMITLTLFILLIVGLFIYSHAKNLRYWPFHFKFRNKWLVILVIAVFILFISLFIHFVLLT